VSRANLLADLVRDFDVHVVEHRDCGALAGSIVEVPDDGLAWGVAWLRCAECGVRWERRLALNGAG